MKLKSAHQCHVATFRQWSDDKTWTVAKILVAIRELRQNHVVPNLQVIFILIKTHLRDPCEIMLCLDLFNKETQTNGELTGVINLRQNTGRERQWRNRPYQR